MIYTIGFTKKSLQQFVELLKQHGVRLLVDVRLRNTSQLAGWSKLPDFAYLLQSGFGIGYRHCPEFAPNGELLDRYKSDRDWTAYESAFNELLITRSPVAEAHSLLEGEDFCLLCTEPTAEKCHRRLVADYLAGLRPGLTIKHL